MQPAPDHSNATDAGEHTPSPAADDRLTLPRREALIAAGFGGLALMLGPGRGLLSEAFAADPVASLAGACTLTKELTEGPYWIENSLTRRNITEGRFGVPLALVFTVRDASTCAVIAGADVEIWHADAAGVYSGFSGGSRNSRRFLRGHQKADSKGRARFTTIYPGWYTSRTPHIHLKVHVGAGEVHTGQVFFPDKVSRAVYRTTRYRSRGQADTTNSEDNIYERGSLLTVTKRAAGKGYLATTTLVVDRS
jgi:protocatechuate 3,4-dioxygenase beta subunit